MQEENNLPIVLVVDDTAENHRLIEEILSEFNIDIVHALNAKQALKYLEEDIPDLILLDVMMPEMDGYQACKIIKEDIRLISIPVIFITAKTTTDELLKGFEAGAIDYITKPFNIPELKARIKTQLNLSKVSKDLNQSIIELKNRDIELNKTIKEKDRLLSIIAHDVKNPFASVLGLADIMLMHAEKFNKEDFLKYAREIRVSSGRIFDLIQNLLEWANMKIGNYAINKESLNINLIITEIIDLYSGVLKQKNVNAINKINSDLVIEADKRMITTVIRNLFGNSIKFTKENGSITFYDSLDKDNIILCIEDTGVGMEKDVIDKLNTGLNHSSNGTNGEKGTGLGLSICREFIEKNNGSINIESELNKGTKISLIFQK